MTQHSLLTPCRPDDYNKLNNLYWRQIRQVQLCQPTITEDALLRHPSILPLVKQFGKTPLIEAYRFPMLFFRKAICTEYASLPYWSRHEATSIASGVDPLYVRLRSDSHTPNMQARHKAVKDKVNAAIEQGALHITYWAGTALLKTPQFCQWALQHEVIDDGITNFFQEIIKGQTPLTVGGRAGAASSLANSRIWYCQNDFALCTAATVHKA